MQCGGKVKLKKSAVYPWNLKLAASNKDGVFTETLKIYSSMVKSVGCFYATNYTFPLTLHACAKLRSLRDGTMLHSHVFLTGLSSDVFVHTALLDMYSKCSDIASSRRVFDEIPLRNRTLVSWNSIISAYSQASCLDESLLLFNQMRSLGLEPSSATFICIVSSVSSVNPIKETSTDLLRQLSGLLSLHSCVVKLGLDSELPLLNALMNMYVRFGRVSDASSIFDSMTEKSVISWTTMLGGFVTMGNFNQVFATFNQMQQERVSPDAVVFVPLISACTRLRNLITASSVHCIVLKSGCDQEDPIDNLLVSMYAKCGDIGSARRVFDMVPLKSVFPWTSLICGYAHSGRPTEAVELFRELLRTSVRPTEITLATILSACADLGSMTIAEEIEDYILQNGLQSDMRVQASLIHMFCRCGSIEKAKSVFERVSNKDLAVWTSMINGYAIHGMGKKALHLFHDMQYEERIKPDAIAYTSILLACSHSGLVDVGLQHLESMNRDFGIKPSAEHYSCLVDLLGRAGFVELAMKTIHEMRLQDQAQLWVPLLGACRTHHKIELGELAANKLLDLNPGSTGIYVLISNFYASVGKWKEAALTRSFISDRGLVKERGWSQIEINGSLHVFTARDQFHPQSVDIYKKLEELHIKLLEAGYITEMDAVIL